MKPCHHWAIAFATVVFAAAASANADAMEQSAQVAQTSEALATTALPEVIVRPLPPSRWYYNPYTSGRTQRPSSLNNILFQHFKVPPGYDAAVALHPYTSGLGPCTEGAQPSQGCRHPTGTPIPASRYEHSPFNQ
jgi:hypothetical protein